MIGQNKHPPDLDLFEGVGAAQAKTKKATLDETPRRIEAWSVSIADIFANNDVRLDATHFDPGAAEAVQKLKQIGLERKPLTEFASLALPGQFARIWATDEDHGVPYFNATDMLSLLGLGVPAGGQRFLSYATNTNIDRLIVREGWLLMTCSGTIGRVFYVPKRLDGWAATHDLIRIIPNKSSMTGYLYAWLSAPMIQAQIFSHTHGGQIDHVTDEQVGSVLLPLLSSEEIKSINRKVMKALYSREKAIEILTNAWCSE